MVLKTYAFKDLQAILNIFGGKLCCCCCCIISSTYRRVKLIISLICKENFGALLNNFKPKFVAVFFVLVSSVKSSRNQLFTAAWSERNFVLSISAFYILGQTKAYELIIEIEYREFFGLEFNCKNNRFSACF